MRDYLYIPLGGNRIGLYRQSVAVLITMLLGGLWHGAGWNFVVWGGFHGLAIWFNQLGGSKGIHIPKVAAWLLTFLFVSFCWVLFRAETFTAALRVYHGLFGLEGVGDLSELVRQLDEIAIAAIIAMVGPTAFYWVQERLKPSKAMAIVIALLFVATLLELGNYGYNEFIYFQF